MTKIISKTLETVKLKRLALKLYFSVTNSARSLRSGARSLIVPRLIRKRQKDGILAIDICNIHGLGSKLEWSLEIMAYCEEKNLAPRIRFSYPDSTDYFSDYFFIKGSDEDNRGNSSRDNRKIRFTKITTTTELGFGKDYGKTLTIDWANRLIGRYLGIKEFITREVDDFCSNRFQDKKVLGVHYRSTDKVGEAPAVPYEMVQRNIEHYIDKYPDTGAVFISTDNDHFREYIGKTFTKRPLIFREDYFRSDNAASVHHNKKLDKFEVNKDALINCLLMSRCHALLKTSSFLSDLSKLFNPRMPVVLLNQPYEHALWFPANQISKETLYPPVL
jgi:hypothetical protein